MKRGWIGVGAIALALGVGVVGVASRVVAQECCHNPDANYRDIYVSPDISRCNPGSCNWTTQYCCSG